MLDLLLTDFLMLLVTIDPIGTLTLFVGMTAGKPDEERPRIAVRAILYSGGVLLLFLVLGQLVLAGLGVQLVSFQLAGGLILFLFGLQMVFGIGVADVKARPEPEHDLAVFPLAMPSIASPGSILAIVVLTDNHRHSVGEQAITAAVLIVVLAITLVLMLQANRVHRWIGNAGANIITRVMGLLLAALATEQFLDGLLQVVETAGG